jgi:hypothetical protein
MCNYMEKVKVLDNNTAVVEALDNAKEAETANNDEIQDTTNNTNINEFLVAVDNFEDINVTIVAADNFDKIAVEILETMVVEENSAIGGNSNKENCPLAGVVMDKEPCANYKSTPSEEISCWHESVNELPNDVQIDLAFLRESKL